MMSVGTVLLKRLRVDGFLLLDYASRFLEAATELGQWKMFGKNQRPRDHRGRPRESPRRHQHALHRANTGKLIVKV